MTTVISYSIPGTGYFKSYRGFINDVNGSVPYNWTLNTPLGTYQIIADFNGHNKVLEIDLAGTGVEFITTTFTPATSGTVELQVCKALNNILMDVAVIQSGPGIMLK